MGGDIGLNDGFGAPVIGGESHSQPRIRLRHQGIVLPQPFDMARQRDVRAGLVDQLDCHFFTDGTERESWDEDAGDIIGESTVEVDIGLEQIDLEVAPVVNTGRWAVSRFESALAFLLIGCAVQSSQRSSPFEMISRSMEGGF